MDIEKHARLFNDIAHIYKLFYPYQLFKYRRVLKKYKHYLKVPSEEADGTILDIGCGTGAYSQCLREYGFNVIGIDISDKMVRVGRRRSQDCRHADALVGLPFHSNSFDLVLAAFVAHGLDPSQRYKLFLETRRLSKQRVIFHDYNTKRNLITDLLERLEGGDYFNFIHNVKEELRSVFPQVTEVKVSRQASWYICFNNPIVKNI